MCGIAGIVHADGRPVHRGPLADMIAAIAHRGPDDSGILVQPGAGLAHARLSIVDVAGGAQPMMSADGRLSIVFNGEIFNYLELRADLIARGHRFRTRSDTEVLLCSYAEYGEACLDQLNGQWAFAIWDRQARQLFLSRDRLGVRPLFYTTADGALLFASEIKALFAHAHVPRSLDLAAFDQLLTYWCPLPPRTMFESIRELPPGHSLTLRAGRQTIRRYWTPSFEAPPARREADSVEELRALLDDAVRLRLRADVPVGAYLSGGLDSSITAALARRQVGASLKTFSVSFDDPEFDESAHQAQMSRWLDVDHETLRCSAEDIANVFPAVVRHAETVLLRTAPAPLFLLSAAVQRSGIKTVLTGEGADEMFGGYDIFKEAKIRRFWAALPGSRRRPLLLRRLYPYLPQLQRQSEAYLQAFFKVGAGDCDSPYFSHLPRWTLTSGIKTLLTTEARSAIVDGRGGPLAEPALPGRFDAWHPFCQAQYLETALLLPGYILSSQGDRVAMAHGVEGRHPFLDHRVAQFASSLPPQAKMRVLNEKFVLKQAAAGLVPDAIRRRAKQPYRAPDAASVFTSGDTYVADLLAPGALARDRLFNPVAVAGLVRKCREGRAVSARDGMALAAVISTQLLLDQFVHQSRKVTHASVRPRPAAVHF